MSDERPPDAGAPLMTRRTAIAHVGVAGAVGSMMLTMGCRSTGTVTNPEVDQMKHVHWDEMVGQHFSVEGRSFDRDERARRRRVVLVLDEATDMSSAGDVHRPDHVRDSGISLLFVAPAKEKLPSATYTLDHPGLGRFHLFLHEIPRAERPDQTIYEAVLN